MVSIKASEDIRPMSELKSHGAEIVRQVSSTRRPVIITRHGRGVAVVLSLGEYEELQETLRRYELRQAVSEAERDVEQGEVLPNREVIDKLRRWLDEAEG
jgi:antitoxin YefM